MKRLGCLLLTLAIALTTLAPAVAGPAADLLSGPLQISLLDLSMDAYMPLDDERLGELNNLLRHLTFTLTSAESDGIVWSGLRASVDERPVEEMWIGETDIDVLLALPGSEDLYAAETVDELDALLGTDAAGVAAMMVPEVFLEDAETMVCAFFGNEEYASVRNQTNTVKDTNNTGYGRTVTRRTMIPVTGSQLQRILLSLCPEGPLRDLIASVRIGSSEADAVYALCKADGKPAKAVFRGLITDSRGRDLQADIEWKLRRDDPKLPERDHLTVNLTGEGGGLSFEFRLTRRRNADGSTAVTYDIDRWESGGFSLTRSAARRAEMGWELSPAGRVTGRMDLTAAGPGRTDLTLNLDLDAVGALRGTVFFAIKGERSLRGAAEIGPLETAPSVPEVGEVTLLPEDAEAREAIAAACRDRVAALLVARLALLADGEDTLYLRRGLSDETWSEVVAAARELIQETEGEE